MSEQHQCPLCDSILTSYHPSLNSFSIICPNCGNFALFRDDSIFLEAVFGKIYHNNQYYFGDDTKNEEFNKYRAWLSACVSEKSQEWEDAGRWPTLDCEGIKNLLLSFHIPETPEEKTIRLLSFVNEHSKYFGDWVKVSKKTIFSQFSNELNNIINELGNEGFITCKLDNSPINVSESVYNVSITMKGIQNLGIQKKIDKKEKCFIAMWFDPSMDELYSCIDKACLDVGYKAIRIDRKEHNNDITDEIIKEIKTSSFVIADLTGFRGGVYYETGFARGYGKEVILCCEKDFSISIEYPGIKEKKAETGTHFDVNHINTIYWEKDKLNELKEKLKNRILSTLGEGNYKRVEEL